MRNQRYHASDSKLSENARGLFTPALASGRITPKDESLIREFMGDLAGHISPCREYKLINTLILNREFFPEYSTITTADAQEGVRNLINAAAEDGTPRFKANTKTDRIRIMKRFLLWLCDNGYGRELNEKKIQKITVPPPDRMTKEAGDILTKEEIERMIQAANNSRDRALIATLYEGGLRGRELADLTWGDLKFNEWNVVLNTAGKTGRPRYAPLVMSRPYLAAWKNDYPAEILPDSYVFVNLHASKDSGKYLPVSYSAVSIRLKSLGEAAGITKKISTHIFRHSKITHMLQDEIPESYIKRLMWGSLSTGMLSTYGHIVNDDLDNCIAKQYGIQIHSTEEEKKKEKVLHPRQCEQCGTVNAPTANYCALCGAPLTEKAETGTDSKREELQKMLADDDTVLEVLTFIKSLKTSKPSGNSPINENIGLSNNQ